MTQSKRTIGAKKTTADNNPYDHVDNINYLKYLYSKTYDYKKKKTWKNATGLKFEWYWTKLLFELQVKNVLQMERKKSCKRKKMAKQNTYTYLHSNHVFQQCFYKLSKLNYLKQNIWIKYV